MNSLPTRRGARVVAFMAVAAAVQISGPSAGGRSTSELAGGIQEVRAASGTPVIAAAGDIACDPANSSFDHGKGRGDLCRALKTRRLLDRVSPTAVLALGDLQYDDGSYGKYRRSYARSWGRLRSITHPVPGNHDYWSSSRARGYFRYFHGRAGAKGAGYYSYDLDGWHMVALNSECFEVACARGSSQYDWLRDDLRASAAPCTLAYWHEPRFSSGPHGGTNAVLPFWRLLYRASADVVLNGHDHIYERFHPQDPTGARDHPYGITEFVVGTGGAEQYWIQDRAANSAVRRADVFGVLRMSLRPDSFAWRFLATAGTSFSDHGRTDCHGAPA